MRNILITGGAGFIGFHLAHFHINEGDRVFIIDNFYKQDGKKDSEFEKMKEKCEFIDADLTKGLQLDIKNIDFFYHLAAINGTELFYERSYEVCKTNIEMTLSVLKALENIKCEKLIYASSSEVYADGFDLGLTQIPTSEKTPVVFKQPLDDRFSYGTSKFMGEVLCSLFGKKTKVPTSIIRYHNVYGPRMGKRHVISEFILKSLKKENPFIVKGLNQTRAFCYVDDAVYATYLVAKSEKTNQEIVHIGNPEEIKIEKVLSEILKLENFKPEILDHGATSSSVERRCPDIGKLMRLTGFHPKISLYEGIKLTHDWYLGDFSLKS